MSFSMAEARAYDQQQQEAASRLYHLVELPPPPPSFASLSRTLLESIIFDNDSPHGNALVLHETYVIRLFRKLCDEYRVSWTLILETARHGCALLDPKLHSLLADIWEHRVHRSVSLEEQNCYERVMGRDYVRQSDLLKLAGTLVRVTSEPKRVWTFFGVDGYLGDDPKRYVDHLKYGADDWRGKHVRAVRLLYQYVDCPDMMRDTLEAIFKPVAAAAAAATTAHDNNRATVAVSAEVRDTYTRTVGGWDVVQQIGEWRSEQHKNKKKRAAAEEVTGSSSRGVKKRGKEENGDEETTTGKRAVHVVADDEYEFQPTTPPGSPPPLPPGSPPPLPPLPQLPPTTTTVTHKSVETTPAARKRKANSIKGSSKQVAEDVKW